VGLRRNRFLKPDDGMLLAFMGLGERRRKAVADPG